MEETNEPQNKIMKKETFTIDELFALSLKVDAGWIMTDEEKEKAKNTFELLAPLFKKLVDDILEILQVKTVDEAAKKLDIKNHARIAIGGVHIPGMDDAVYKGAAIHEEQLLAERMKNEY